MKDFVRVGTLGCVLLFLLSAPVCRGAQQEGDARIKVALYLDIGCRGGGVIHWAQLLRSSPDVDCAFLDAADVLALDARPDVDVIYVSGEQMSEGALDHVDALIIPGGRHKGMWSAAIPLIERFKALGRPVYASCRDIRIEEN